MNHVMVDLETLGVKPGCAILSIGAVEFNLDTGETGQQFYVGVDKVNCHELGLVSDSNTVKWWQNQSVQARAKAFNGQTKLVDALQQFTDFYKSCGASKIWGNSASFDCSILAACYDTVNLPIPWSVWNERCFRTVKGLFPNNIPTKDEAKAHDPIYDCLYQIKVLTGIWQRIHNRY